MAEKPEYGNLLDGVKSLISDKVGSIDIVALQAQEILDNPGYAAKIIVCSQPVCLIGEEELERLHTRAPIKVQFVLQEYHEQYRKVHQWKKNVG